jgi:hypothetical protein
MTGIDEEILDDLFHGCAFLAYMEQAALAQGPPDSEATRRRAYQLYEQALAEKNAGMAHDRRDRLKAKS